MSSWLEQYANTASTYVDAPTLFQKAAAYWTLGAALAKKVYFPFGMMRIYPNLFTVLVGRSGAIKKSITKDFALDVLDHALPEIDLPGRGSPEAFRDALDEKGWYGVLHYDEFAEFLSKRKKDYTADMDVTIMELFAHGRKTPIRTKTSGEIRIPKDAIISFIAPTTIEYLLRGIHRDDFMSGKMARFMMVEADQDIEYPVPPTMPASVPQQLGGMLKTLIPNVAKAIPMGETAGARAVLEEYYFAIKKRVNDVDRIEFQSAFSRAQVYAIKFAMIRAVAQGRMTVQEQDYLDILPILKNWAECLKNLVEKISAEDRFQVLIDKADHYMRKRKVLSQRDLQRYMRLRKYEMKDLIDYFQEAGIIEVAIDARHKGRNVLKYHGNGKADHLTMGVNLAQPPTARPAGPQTANPEAP